MSLPVGYHQFHKNSFINYQLNRWYALGYTRKEDIESIGKSTQTFEDYVRGFEQLAEEAVNQNRLQHAAFYYRAAEFLVAPGDSASFCCMINFTSYFIGLLPTMVLNSTASLMRPVFSRRCGCDRLMI
jgi:hypothetical protein